MTLISVSGTPSSANDFAVVALLSNTRSRCGAASLFSFLFSPFLFSSFSPLSSSSSFLVAFFIKFAQSAGLNASSSSSLLSFSILSFFSTSTNSLIFSFDDFPALFSNNFSLCSREFFKNLSLAVISSLSLSSSPFLLVVVV